MSTIVTRAGKGSPLTNTEFDANFTNLNTDKLEVATAASTYQPLDGDLTAIAALASTGYAKRTGTNTWAVSAAIPGSDITGAIDGVTVGSTTRAAGAFTSLKVNTGSFLGSEVFCVTGDSNISSRLGVLGPYLTDNIISVGPGTHPSSNTALNSVAVSVTAPSTATNRLVGYSSKLSSTATAYTIASLWNFVADTSTKGAGSTITNAIGFYAKSGMATGSNNYGFYSDINSGATSYQLYMNGTATNYIGSSLMIGTISLVGSEKLRVAGSTNTDTLVVNTLATINPVSASTMDNVAIGTTTSSTGKFTYIGSGQGATIAPTVSVNATYPPSAGTDLTFFNAQGTVPSTNTGNLWGFKSLLSTSAASFTLTNLYNFDVNTGSLGAGSTVTNLYGYRILSGAAYGSNNYGFYSGINAAATNYGLYMAGTAYHYLNGEVGIRMTPSTNASLTISAPSGAGATTYAINATNLGATTATTAVYGVFSLLATTAAAYTTTSTAHFYASNTSKGAGSIITNSYGFSVANGIAVGTNNYGFYSAINTASNTYQLYMGGTAESYFGGNVTVLSTATLGFGAAGAQDTILARDAANTLALKNSTTAQTFRVYGTTTGPKYLSLSHDGTNAIVDTNASGGRLSLGGNASSIFGLSNLLFTDNSFDIGASGTNRPRSGYFSASVTAATSFIVGSNQVVGARDTGWTAMTGSTNKATSYDTSTVTTAQLAGRVMALQAALTTHGLIGA